MMRHVLQNVNNGTLMDDNEKNSRAAKILMSLLPPHAMIVLTAMSTLEIIIAKRKKRMADLVDSMDERPTDRQKIAWQTELEELLKDYAMLTAMVVDAYESVLGIGKSPKLEGKAETDEELLKRMGIDPLMLVPGPDEVQ